MISVARLLARGAVRRLWQRRLGSLLLVMAIAITTALCIAVFYASYASINSFERSTVRLSESDTVQLRSRSGDFSEAVLAGRFSRVDPDIGIAAVLESEIVIVSTTRGEERATLIGAGLVGAAAQGSVRMHGGVQTGSLNFSAEGLLRYGLQAGQLVTIRIGETTATLPATLLLGDVEFGVQGDSVVLCDLGCAQRLLGKRGRISALLFAASDQSVREGLVEDLAQVAAQLSAAGTPLFVQTEESRREMSKRLLGAFRANILIMVAMAFLICVLSVFNAAYMSTLSVQQDYRTLRTLGVSRGVLFVVVLFESLFLGGAGALLGLTMGRPLVNAVSNLFLGTVQELYLGASIFPTLGLWKGAQLYRSAAGCALLACLLGSLYPAWKVSGVSGGFSLGGIAATPTVSTAKHARGALLASAAALVMVFAALKYERVLLAHASALFVILSLFLFSTPLLAALKLSPVRSMLQRMRSPGLLALSNTLSALGSHAFTTGVGAAAISLLIALSVMVGSFRSTLQDWVNYTFRADIYVRPEAKGGLFSPTSIDEKSIREIAALDEVREVSRYSFFVSELQGEMVSIAGADIEMGTRHGLYHVLAGRIDVAKLQVGDEILVTETAARKLRRKAGDTLVVDGRVATIGAVFQDFSSERGTLLYDRTAFLSRYPDIGVSTLGIYLRSPADGPALQERLRRAFAQQPLYFTLNSDLRALVFRIFDQTFKITGLMRGIVVLMCGFGFVVTMLQLMQERRREIKTLYTLGMSWTEIRASMLLEALIIAGPSVLLGAAGGTVLALLLIEVINPISFGWSFNPVFAWRHYWSAALIVLISNLLASLIPGALAHGKLRQAKVSEE